MSSPLTIASKYWRHRLTGSAALLLSATSGFAQDAAPVGAPAPSQADSTEAQKPVPETELKIPTGRPATPAQQVANALPPPGPGGRPPVPPVPPGAPMPSADPRDFSGTWYHDQNLVLRNRVDMFGEPVPFKMEGAKTLERRVMAKVKGTPYINASARCRPPGQFFQLDLNFPFQIFQSQKGLEFVFREYHGRWNIAFDRTALPPGEHYMGNSVAHWDGNTLVVATDGYKDPFLIDVDGTPVAKTAKLIHRIRKVDFGDREPYIEMIVTIIDPEHYTRPWSLLRLFNWYPSATLFTEYNCEEQIGDPNLNIDAGLIPEPVN